jgi:hypothetical protein
MPPTIKFKFFTILLPLLSFLLSCSGNDNKLNEPAITESIEKLSGSASPDIMYEDGWTIVSKIEDGNRVYWFLAPERDNVSPALFKKVIYANDESGLKTKFVSQCEAPKQTCDELMEKFRKLSEKYK